MIQKALLTCNWPGGPLRFTVPFPNWQHQALILRVWALMVGVDIFWIISVPCYVNSDGKGIESVARKTGQNMK